MLLCPLCIRGNIQGRTGSSSDTGEASPRAGEETDEGEPFFAAFRNRGNLTRLPGVAMQGVRLSVRQGRAAGAMPDMQGEEGTVRTVYVEVYWGGERRKKLT